MSDEAEQHIEIDDVEETPALPRVVDLFAGLAAVFTTGFALGLGVGLAVRRRRRK